MDGRAIIITGGARGIGRSFAEACLGDGYRVMITAARGSQELAATADDLAGRYGASKVAARLADAGDPEAAAALVADALDQFGAIHALINNAGRGPREISETFTTQPPKFWETDPDAWREIVRTNVDGPFLAARAVAPHMIAAGAGRIVNISTSAVTMVRNGYAPYGPSKAALDAMTRIFAADLEGTGVTVNALAPGGATDTSFIPGDGSGRRGADGNLLPVDVMNPALLWLLSDASAGTTGARLIGRKWDPALDPAEAALAAREDCGEPPRIL
ncbi:MAG: SDR family NAD(P)-dependent oxidoreductase [Inquilinaceae bacterium]